MKRIALLLLLSILFLNACGKITDEQIFYKIQKKYNKMESYSCFAKIIINGGKELKEYKVKQIFKRPNKYIIQIIEPEESKGITTVYNGEQAWIYHPQIDQSILIRDYKDSPDENMFVGYFLRNLITTEMVKLESERIEDNDYLIITTMIPGNNKYRMYQKLWVDKKTYLPYKLYILDKDEKIAVEIYYSKFLYNIDIKDEKFEVYALKN
ncbi:hypothetical protein Y919_05660 [Caloranaerobacter azorensis H53214]|uniref:Outer membrane lipoprotein carrier protein LolA n=1 Tax=Caloranaerobacter azorensis H53214 TaxID=1156417 RepID=A0A096BIH3_9FIRM|nr:outer membrane lipoprotein carrier protein LolA [Caloranaerobacter azorensis]KGG80523.1 hypothetical protein Y919_05660 [Caloranaerobacter azorensis H53214]